MPLTNTALRYQVLLEGLKTREAQEFAGIVRTIGAAVSEWTQQISNPKLNAMGREEFRRLALQLRTALEERLANGGQALLDQLPEIGMAGAEFEARTLNRTVDAHFEEPTSKSVRDSVLKQPLSANGQTVTNFIQNWVAAQPQKIVDYAQQSYARGATVQDMIKGLRGTKANGFKDGLLNTTRREAEAIARTTVQHAASIGRMETWKKNSDVIEGYQFVATLDSRTTAVCRALDGRVWNLEEGPVPPLHINCRSTTVAKVDPALDFLDEGATRSSLDGPVDAQMTYYDWLATQPAAFQDEVLGPERGALFRDGGMTPQEFADRQLDRNFKPRTLDQLRKLEPLAFAKKDQK